jgi:hypothetical protein
MPEPAGMPEDGRVHPGEMGAEPWSQPPLPDLDKLLEIARHNAEAAASFLKSEELKWQRKRDKGSRKRKTAGHRARPTVVSRDAKDRLPRDPQLHTYRGLRETYQDFQTRAQTLKHRVRVVPLDLMDAGAPHPRTQKVHMALFGLEPVERYWPPSTWPSEAPNGRISLVS